MPAEPQPAAVTVTYDSWRQVPPTLATRTQLAHADLPRQPGGPVRAYVNARDFRDKKTRQPLYLVAEAEPTAASAAQLAAAAARRMAIRQCEDCGARAQQPLTAYEDRHLCAMCRSIARVRERQRELREGRPELSAWARRLLGLKDLAIVWAEVQAAEPTGSGRARPPLSTRVTAVDHGGKALCDLRVQLAGPRTPGVPGDAVPAGEAAAVLRDRLGGRRLMGWTPVALEPVVKRLAALGHQLDLAWISTMPGPDWNGWDTTMRGRAAQWRAEFDPSTGDLLPAWEPGRADRLHLMLTRIAAG
ncbi:hypothetical protein ACWC0C_39100 [Streptomyces sp. NPDC001709]